MPKDAHDRIIYRSEKLKIVQMFSDNHGGGKKDGMFMQWNIVQSLKR